MVAAEAAACGSPPLLARHSGLAEIADGLAAEYPSEHRHLTSFESGDVDDLRRKLTAIRDLPRDEWLKLSQAARRTAVASWNWEHVAAEILR
jgi:glycosyltransferase involved in cell wall biosynthesis